MIEQMNREAFSNYSKEELLNLWRKLPTKDKAPTTSKILIRELAYRLQEQQFGKLDKNTTVSLRRHMTVFSQSLANGKTTKASKVTKKTFLEAGSLIRKTWQGKECLIKVLDQSLFEYHGQTYKSLSAVARAITGQHLSGPLFFDLKNI